MKEAKKQKGTIISIGVAVVLIALCAVFLNTMLAHAAEAEDDVVHTQSIDSTLDTLSVDIDLPDGLNTVVYLNGRILPDDGVTAQYAIAITSEIAERVFGKPLTGRVFAELPPDFMEDSPLTWNVRAEVDGGIVNCTVDTKTGQDKNFHYSAINIDWTWFDGWAETIADQERADAEEMYKSVRERDSQALASQPQPTDEEILDGINIKRQGMLDFAAQMSEKPHGAKAVEFVNSTGIGDGTTAIVGLIMMEGGHNDIATYLVEVELDNGKYIVLTMDQNSMELLAYERYDTTLAKYLYG